MTSSYLGEYLKHSFNSLNYKRKEKNILNNDYLKLNILYDSFYVKNKIAYITISNENCMNNICSYCLIDKRINIYSIKIKNYNINEIIKVLELVEKSHLKILIIHCFKISNLILTESNMFRDNWHHLSITPYNNNYDNKLNYHYYFDFLCGKTSNITNINIHDSVKNVYLINLPMNTFLENQSYKDKNIKIKYIDTDLYISLRSLIIGRNKVNNFK
jgi:hypothetical protein